MKKVLISGSSGLVGSECVKLFCERGFEVTGIDNDRRAYFFGDSASTEPMKRELLGKYKNFLSIPADIRDHARLIEIFKMVKPDLVIHSAAQPAHDWSIENTVEDFHINAVGTVNMLDCFRRVTPEGIFIQVSTSKVYGDCVNDLPLVINGARYAVDFTQPTPDWVNENGITEEAPIQAVIHSPFGASKACGDLMAQEFALYYNLRVAIFRPVCITGAAHMGAKLHGYLAYLVKCLAKGDEYIVNGYGGRQVRDNIHASDLAAAFYEVYSNGVRVNGRYYNIGGSVKSNNSILEAIADCEKILGKKGNVKFSDIPRRGDHKWCVFDTSLFEKDYPNWVLKYDNASILNELCEYHSTH